MDMEEAEGDQQEPSSQAGRPPPIILTSATNLLQLQKKLRSLVKGKFHFRTRKNGTTFVTRETGDFSAIKAYFTSKNLSFFTFFPKSQQPVKAVLRHLPSVTPAENISEALTELGFDAVSVKQMYSARRTKEEGSQPKILPLFLITLPRTKKSLEIFKLTGLCHIAVKVEAYRNRNGLTQCYNCQKFGHVWSNCSQPPRCMLSGGGHLHNDCPEKENTSSTPSCCNCNLADGEKPHPSNYRGCSLAKEEIRRRRSQREPKNKTGRVFSSKYATPDLSFATAVCTNQEQQQPSPARLQFQVPPQGRSSRHRFLRKRSKQHPHPSSITHTRERRGLQPPRRTSGQTDIMTKVSQSRFHLIASNLWSTCS
jgi:hypothetical protein